MATEEQKQEFWHALGTVNAVLAEIAANMNTPGSGGQDKTAREFIFDIAEKLTGKAPQVAQVVRQLPAALKAVYGA